MSRKQHRGDGLHVMKDGAYYGAVFAGQDQVRIGQRGGQRAKAVVERRTVVLMVRLVAPAQRS